MTVRSNHLARRSRRLVPAIVLASAASLLSTTVEAQFPTTPPPPAPIRPTQLPPIREATLPNGVHLLVVESHKLPVLSVNMAFRAGDFTDGLLLALREAPAEVPRAAARRWWAPWRR